MYICSTPKGSFFTRYVLVTSVDPLRIFLYKEGMVRFATVEYEPPNNKNINNTYIHLTNYAINKTNKNFKFSENGLNEGHKRTLKGFWTSLKSIGIETDLIQTEIKDIIIKTFLSVQHQLSHQYKCMVMDDIDGSNCFEILGFDILLDENLDPLLLEVNHAPSFATESILDLNLKTKLLQDSFKLLNVNSKRRKLSPSRALSKDERDLERKFANTQRHKYEMDNIGDYEILFPLVDDKGSIIGRHNRDYLSTAKENTHSYFKMSRYSKDSTIDGSKNGLETDTQCSMVSADIMHKQLISKKNLPSLEGKNFAHVATHTPEHISSCSELEKLTIKYQRFMNDGLSEWERFTLGGKFNIKQKLIIANQENIKK